MARKNKEILSSFKLAAHTDACITVFRSGLTQMGLFRKKKSGAQLLIPIIIVK
jgi:hypothetical protein